MEPYGYKWRSQLEEQLPAGQLGQLEVITDCPTIP